MQKAISIPSVAVTSRKTGAGCASPKPLRRSISMHASLKDRNGTCGKNAASKACALAASAALLLTPVGAATANDVIAEFGTSGLIPVPGVFRDTVKVLSLDDPGVEGVKVYYTDYSRSLVERISSDPFSDPSQASLTCVATGPVVVKDPKAAMSKDGVEVFSELKTLNL